MPIVESRFATALLRTLFSMLEFLFFGDGLGWAGLEVRIQRITISRPRSVNRRYQVLIDCLVVDFAGACAAMCALG